MSDERHMKFFRVGSHQAIRIPRAFEFRPSSRPYTRKAVALYWNR